MTRSIRFNGEPIEKLSKLELLNLVEVCCNQIEDWKMSAEHWKRLCENMKAEDEEAKR